MPSVYDYVNGDNEATSKVGLKIRFLGRFFLVLDFQKGYIGLMSCHMVLYELFLLLNSYMTQFIHEIWLSDAFSAVALFIWNPALYECNERDKASRKRWKFVCGKLFIVIGRDMIKLGILIVGRLAAKSSLTKNKCGVNLAIAGVHWVDFGLWAGPVARGVTDGWCTIQRGW